MYLYSIFDLKANYYGPIFECRTDEDAKRALVESFTGRENKLTQYPEDFALFNLGEFDSSTGSLTQSYPVKIITCLEAMAQHKEMLRRVERSLTDEPRTEIAELSENSDASREVDECST